MEMKKGLFFTLDSILASGIIVIAIILVGNFYSSEKQNTNVNYAAQDIVKVLSSLKVGEVDNEFIRNLTQSGIITDLNNTILEQIGEFWAEGKNFSYNISRNLTDAMVPQNYGFSILVNGEEIYSRSRPIRGTLVSSRKIISGISEGKPTDGYTARAVLKGIKSKKTSTYVYFGGYEGDGNLTKKFFLPSDLIAMNSSYLEVADGGTFNLYINSIFAGTYIKNSGGGGDMLADKWNITNPAYLAAFKKGENTLWLNFTSNYSYVAGGFLKITYTTSSYNDTQTPGYKKEYLPGINGVINLYSSIYIPENLNYMKVFLNFSSNYTSLFFIGNATLFQNNTNGSTKSYIISNSTISSLLDYNYLSQKTVPIRFGIKTNATITGNADAVIVTDVSGSMEWCAKADDYNSHSANHATKGCYRFLGNWRYDYHNMSPNNGYVDYNRTIWNNGTSDLCGCRYHAVCKNDTTKISIYVNSSLKFLEIFFNFTSNRLGIAEFSSQSASSVYQGTCNTANPTTTVSTNGINRFQNLTSNTILLSNLISSTTTWWGTCICCGINKAVETLKTAQDPAKKKYIVLMTDGAATVECSQQPNGTATADAVQSAWDACNPPNNISLYAIGFGNDADIATMKRMNCSGGKYYNATNTQQLESAYREIAGEINKLTYSEQVSNASGALLRTTLESNSYIELNYTPSSSISLFNKLPLGFESDRFGNNISLGNLLIYPNTSIYEAKVTSYSGSKWTDKLLVNGINVFTLSTFGYEYQQLGDPFTINIPQGIMTEGNNNIAISTGITPFNATGGSNDDRVIYTLLLNGFSDYGGVVAKSQGCIWQLEFEDGSSANVNVPLTYSGTSTCIFRTGVYDTDDAINNAAMQLLKNLDLDKDGLLDVNIDANSLDVSTLSISKVPSLWGPAIVEIRVWE